MPEEQNSFLRMAVAMERVADGAGKPFKDRTFDFTTEDGQTNALAAVIRVLGGEVEGA